MRIKTNNSILRAQAKTLCTTDEEKLHPYQGNEHIDEYVAKKKNEPSESAAMFRRQTKGMYAICEASRI